MFSTDQKITADRVVSFSGRSPRHPGAESFNGGICNQIVPHRDTLPFIGEEYWSEDDSILCKSPPNEEENWPEQGGHKTASFVLSSSEKDDGPAINGTICKKNEAPPEEEQYGPEDVLAEQGGRALEHAGNRRFHQILKTLYPKFCEAPEKKKSDIYLFIQRQIEDNGGRFLRRNAEGKYTTLSPKDVKKRISQALRDMKKQNRKRERDAEVNQLKVKLAMAAKKEDAMAKQIHALQGQLLKHDPTGGMLVHSLVLQNAANSAKDTKIDELTNKLEDAEKRLQELETVGGGHHFNDALLL